MPKPGVEVPILYRPRKNSRPQLYLACWDPYNEGLGPGWDTDMEFFHADKVAHWLKVQLPPKEP